jgi:hypothetical protein
MALLESVNVEIEHPPTVEEALYVWAQHQGVDFADCLLRAHVAHLGRRRFLTFDVDAAHLPGAELLQWRRVAFLLALTQASSSSRHCIGVSSGSVPRTTD